MVEILMTMMRRKKSVSEENVAKLVAKCSMYADFLNEHKQAKEDFQAYVRNNGSVVDVGLEDFQELNDE